MNFGTSYKLTSVNNFWFSACRHCVVFFAVAKGDWVMCVGTGSWALSGETFLAWRSGLDLEAEEEGWGLSSSSPSSSSTMILSAIEAGATAIQNAGFLKYKQAEWDQNRMTHKHQNFSVFMICTIFTLAQKKVTNSGHVGTSDYLNTKAGTCSVNRVQQTQDIFIWFQREPVSGHIHMKDLKHRQL